MSVRGLLRALAHRVGAPRRRLLLEELLIDREAEREAAIADVVLAHLLAQPDAVRDERVRREAAAA